MYNLAIYRDWFYKTFVFLYLPIIIIIIIIHTVHLVPLSTSVGAEPDEVWSDGHLC